MPRRMSNRDRIDRMRAEAEATQREKERARSEAAAVPGATRKPKASAAPARLKLVWAVKDGKGEVVATYPYARKDAAEAEASRLKATTQRDHIVTPHKVPFDEL